MAGQRKRKHAAADEQPASKRSKASTRAQNTIDGFTNVSKPCQAVANVKEKKKTVRLQQHTPPPQPACATVLVFVADKKRKRRRDSIDGEEVAVSGDNSRNQAEQGASASTPRNKRFKNLCPPSPAATPSKRAAALLGKMSLSADPQLLSSGSGSGLHSYDTPPDTPEAELAGVSLSLELHQLGELFSSFLSALSLHYSHNGTSSPVNAGTLLPMITKHWNRRRVTMDDLRRILAIHHQADPDFSLQDCGRAGICLVRSQPRGRALKRAVSYIDEDGLNSRFSKSLQKSWQDWQAQTTPETCAASAFLQQLPFLEITPDSASQKMAPLFARGQQRLADLKASQAAAASKATSATTHYETKDLDSSTQGTQNRGAALLDRILAKQSLASGLPAGPTKAQLERKSALHRIEDIARVLSLLVGTKERSSHSLQAVTQHLQQSLRNPISREEAERCLGLMAKEIVPGFVRIVQSGEVYGVVIMRSAQVGLGELRARVQRAEV